ncbi:hypothetical protein RW1_056_00110 [Rhodococcus wratislaviensis NBRC 100605]|uniref:ArsR family transcriptional regulator n=1 Tax=Rhodococcus wratislaviensis NBRC 100605 TaxID=1219028 RepID=X0RC44_RHOWR|nr:hypothetical protein RW1_056_00110 [Rhodococcus wratislaviensis NBRC 100605]
MSQTHHRVDLFALYTDPTRVRVVWALTAGERQVNEIAETVGAPYRPSRGTWPSSAPHTW